MDVSGARGIAWQSDEMAHRFTAPEHLRTVYMVSYVTTMFGVVP